MSDFQGDPALTTESVDTPRPPAFVVLVALVWVAAALVGAFLMWYFLVFKAEVPEEANPVATIIAAIIVAILGLVIGRGLFRLKNWARTAAIGLLLLAGGYYAVVVMFDVFSQIFGGQQIVPIVDILEYSALGILRVLAGGLVPLALIYGLGRYGDYFRETTAEREFTDRSVWYILIAAALSAILIVLLIILFTGREAWQAITEVGIIEMIFGMVWRPGSIIGVEGAQFGMLPMIVGSILSTFGALVIGVPLSLGAAILLSEVAPQWVRELLRPVIELLAGIPSVVYGLFGMAALAAVIRLIPVTPLPGRMANTGFGLLNASIILAIMILPTVTNIAEDAIRAVPRAYKEGSLAMGATHWQTIRTVMLPAARSGIIAAIILGVGRALGETMAMIMVIGNSIAMPTPLNDNPLTLFLATARTLTGNIAVEINYSTGAHRSALFFSGVLLFVMLLGVNSLARWLMKER